MKPEHTIIALCALVLAACAASDLKPVDIYPEDMCSQCRMAISNPVFASEIISVDREVFKFDDLGCFFTFRKKKQDVTFAAMFVRDYESNEWLPYETSTIVETDVDTPMGSGKLAFKSSTRAHEFANEHPPAKRSGGCSAGCCGGEGH